MTQTPEEKRAYMRGYNAGSRDHSDSLRKADQAADGYRRRLTDPGAAHRCDGCARWTRTAPSHKWGYCDGQWVWMEGNRWIEVNNRAVADARMVTQEQFGCIQWIPAK